MPTQYFAANHVSEFVHLSDAPIPITTAGRFNSDFATHATFSNISTNFQFETPRISGGATGTIWFAVDLYTASVNGRIWFELMNGTTPILRARCNSTNPDIIWEYWNGSTYVATSDPVDAEMPLDTVIRLTVKVDLNSGFEFYQDGVLVQSGSGWTGGATSFTHVRFGAQSYVSNVRCADYDIRDSNYMSAAFNGDSASNTAGSGSYTDIWASTSFDDYTRNNVSTSTGKEGQTRSAITVPTGYAISAAITTVRARVDGTTITDGKLGYRVGGTNYSSSALGLTTGTELRQVVQATNPATATAWTESTFNSAETYFEAV